MPPMSAPLTVSTPPTTTSSTIGIASGLNNAKSWVAAVPRCMPSSAPANPAMAAASPYTASLVVKRLTPSVAHAASLSRSAMRRRPKRPRRSHTTKIAITPKMPVTSNR